MIEQTERDAPPPSEPPLRWSLVPLWTTADELPSRVDIGVMPVTIGRTGGGCTVSVADPRISRTHATIALSGRAAVVVDGSTNGTFVDGARIADRALLEDGCVVRTGNTFFVVRARPHELGDADVAGLVGRSPAMQRLRADIALVAPTEASVLVLGETGTGKELVASAIHARSGRRGALCAVNCAAIPESMADSHLFGHVAGAFTGAKAAHDGVFRRAHQGTLFLDEIAEAAPVTQARLLRVLEDRRVVPLGAERAIPVDVRIVCATNVDLRVAVERGAFRGDLYARLADLTVRTPPLRDRAEDVLPLLATVLGPRIAALAPDLVHELLLHAWPFNVRELLKLAAELAVRGAGRAVLEPSLVEQRLSPRSSPETERPETERPAARSASSPPPGPRLPAADVSRELVERTWEETGGNVSETARRLGRSRRQVRRYLETYGVRVPDDA